MVVHGLKMSWLFWAHETRKE